MAMARALLARRATLTAAATLAPAAAFPRWSANAANVSAALAAPLALSPAPSALSPSLRWSSSQPSLSESILSSEKRKEEEKSHKDPDGGEGGGYEPLTKWQKFGYAFFAVMMVGGAGSTAVMFSESKRKRKG